MLKEIKVWAFWMETPKLLLEVKTYTADNHGECNATLSWICSNQLLNIVPKFGQELVKILFGLKNSRILGTFKK